MSDQNWKRQIKEAAHHRGRSSHEKFWCQVNDKDGRDHHNKAFLCLPAGGGSVGSSDLPIGFIPPDPASQASTGRTKSSVNLDPATYMRMSNPPSLSVSSSGGTGLLIPYMTKMLWSSICTAVG